MPKSKKIKLVQPVSQPPALSVAFTWLKNWRQHITKPTFAKRYLLVALLILLVSTTFWAVLSARLQAGNADQSVSAFLFEHRTTLRQATLPGQHTFLLKWPLFLLIRLFGYSARSFMVLTVITVLATVGGLVSLLGSIERRPLVLGTLCLMLASVLMLVPPMPYSGGILPVNMAMLTTRNLEYLAYIASLVLLLKSRKLLSWQFISAVTLMALLVASDKLFLWLSLGGALSALLMYALVQRRQLASLGARWVVHGLAAATAAVGLLGLLGGLGITHVSGGGGAGPYGLIHSLHALLLGGFYALFGLLTNFGANPAFDALQIRGIPHQAWQRLVSLAGVSYLINGVVLVAAVWVAWRLLKTSLVHQSKRKQSLHEPTKLAVILLWSSLASLVLFAATNHYYVVDARYLTITVFAAFVGFAAYSTSRKWPAAKLVITGLLLSFGLLCGASGVLSTYRAQSAALTTINDQNDLVAQVLSQHPVDVLVGDYWRVLPIKLQAPRLTVMPLESCTQARQTLSSAAWQPDLTQHSFAYLVSLKHGLTDYPTCSLEEITTAYGRPNSSALIAGSFDKPTEQLLFYDQGAHRSVPQKKPSTVVPITADELPNTTCSSPTVMNIVAHQDDDLLFMNPDLLHDIKAGHCIRTIYVTAGDAGDNQFYWLGREHGSEAAYNSMAGLQQDIWVERIVKLNDNAYITVANPRANPKLTLIFMHLPDGNIDGSGFKVSQFESLQKLDEGRGGVMHTVDKQSSYTSEGLLDALSSLMTLYQPSVIRAQANYSGHQYRDHSDHMAVGRFVKKAYVRYEAEHYENHVTIPLSFYMSYPVHELAPNVSGEDLEQKEAAFFAYSQFDRNVCSSAHQCAANPAYGAYLPRQYQEAE